MLTHICGIPEIEWDKMVHRMDGQGRNEAHMQGASCSSAPNVVDAWCQMDQSSLNLHIKVYPLWFKDPSIQNSRETLTPQQVILLALLFIWAFSVLVNMS